MNLRHLTWRNPLYRVIPVAVWQPCELLYTCYLGLLTYLPTKWRSYRDYRLCDVTSSYALRPIYDCVARLQRNVVSTSLYRRRYRAWHSTSSRQHCRRCSMSTFISDVFILQLYDIIMLRLLDIYQYALLLHSHVRSHFYSMTAWECTM